MVLQNYATTLAQQLGKYTTHEALGLKLTERQLNELRDDQVGQLFELFQEIQRQSSTTDDGSGCNSQTVEGGAQSPLTEDNSSQTILSEDGDNARTAEGDTKSQTSPTVSS